MRLSIRRYVDSDCLSDVHYTTFADMGIDESSHRGFSIINIKTITAKIVSDFFTELGINAKVVDEVPIVPIDRNIEIKNHESNYRDVKKGLKTDDFMILFEITEAGKCVFTILIVFFVHLIPIPGFRFQN